VTPDARRRLIRLLAVVGLIVVLVWLMSSLESVTTVVMTALFLAYLLDPPVDRLEAWRLPRWLAALVVLLGGFFLGFMILLYIVPTVIHEITAFASRAPTYFAALKEYFVRVLQQYEVPLPGSWDEVSALILQKVEEWLPNLRSLADPLAKIMGTVFRSTLAVISALIHIILVPVLAYYFLVSFKGLKAQTTELIPPYARENVLAKLREMDQAVSGFVRGQLTICFILAVLYSIGFLLIGIDMPIVLGLTSGLLFIIPYVGTMFGIVSGCLMALAKFGDIIHVLYVVLWIAAVQLLEGYILTPRIVGRATGLHPVVYIVALLAGAKLFGFVGMLVAIPAAAVIKVLLKAAVEAYRKSDLYQNRDLQDTNQ
jgi:predicted PurR-regulated permease PerM